MSENDKALVSFVIPCYRSKNTVKSVVDEIFSAVGALNKYRCEIILVNDCSPDETFSVLRELAGSDARITAIDLAKNFGQASAIMAGLHHCRGDIIVCMDDDGQTPACEVGKLLDVAGGGAGDVLGVVGDGFVRLEEGVADGVEGGCALVESAHLVGQ